MTTMIHCHLALNAEKQLIEKLVNNIVRVTYGALPFFIRHGGDSMAVHSGGKVGKAGKTLATKSSSKSAKSKAGKTLADHKAKKH